MRFVEFEEWVHMSVKRYAAKRDGKSGEMSNLEREFITRLIQLSDLPEPETEFRFHPERRWRFDFSYPDKKLAIELEGGTWQRGGGRHSRPAGYAQDCEKYNEATTLGWRVLRFTSDMIRNDPIGCIAIVMQCYENGAID